MQAMLKDIVSQHALDTWNLVDRSSVPVLEKINSKFKWVLKRINDGSLKARIVMQGFCQALDE